MDMINTKHRSIVDGYELKIGVLNKKRHETESLANKHQQPVVWHKAQDFYCIGQSRGTRGLT